MMRKLIHFTRPMSATVVGKWEKGKQSLSLTLELAAKKHFLNERWMRANADINEKTSADFVKNQREKARQNPD